MNYARIVHYNAGVLASPLEDGSSKAGDDSANDGFNAFSANLGYRAFLSDRVYVSGEIEGAVYSNAVQGFFEGTYTGNESLIPSEKRISRSMESGQEPQASGSTHDWGTCLKGLPSWVKAAPST